MRDYHYEGRFTPTDADGECVSCNICTKTRKECEEKLAALNGWDAVNKEKSFRA